MREPGQTSAGNMLVVYGDFYPWPSSLAHLYCFHRYSGMRCVHWNASRRPLPASWLKAPWDVIVFQTVFLSYRWAGAYAFEQLIEKVRPLADLPAVRVAMPQDEYFRSALLGRFIEAVKIDCVFSVAPPDQWPVIYPSVDFKKVKFVETLTGYLDEGLVARVGRELRRAPRRTLDIGYRTKAPRPWLGRHGMLKTRVGDVFKAAAAARGLKADIETDIAKTIFGFDWFRFLMRCRYAIGVEGGASILDRDGDIAERAKAYWKQHPQADADELERQCYPGMEGSVKFWMLSPRHLEACLTKTCQILIEGRYNEVLRPGVHYIEVKQDFGNLDAVLDGLADEARREQIAQRAYEDVVLSGRWTYRGFVRRVMEEIRPLRRVVPGGHGRLPARLWLWMRATDWLGRAMARADQAWILPALKRLDGRGRTFAEDRKQALWRTLSARGIQKVLVYGAGKYTAALVPFVRGVRPEIAGIMDDNPSRTPGGVCGLPVFSVQEAPLDGVDAVVLGTDTFQAQMKKRLAASGRVKVPVIDLYELRAPFALSGEWWAALKLRTWLRSLHQYCRNPNF